MWCFCPRRCARKNSGRRRNRSQRGNPWRRISLRADADREPLSATLATSGQDLAAVAGRHASAETMLLSAPSIVRLVGAFHAIALRQGKGRLDSSGPPPLSNPSDPPSKGWGSRLPAPTCWHGPRGGSSATLSDARKSAWEAAWRDRDPAKPLVVAPVRTPRPSSPIFPSSFADIRSGDPQVGSPALVARPVRTIRNSMILVRWIVTQTADLRRSCDTSRSALPRTGAFPSRPKPNIRRSPPTRTSGNAVAFPLCTSGPLHSPVPCLLRGVGASLARGLSRARLARGQHLGLATGSGPAPVWALDAIAIAFLSREGGQSSSPRIPGARGAVDGSSPLSRKVPCSRDLPHLSTAVAGLWMGAP